MSGLVGIGSTLGRRATGIYGDAASMESARRNETEMAEGAEKAQAVGMAGSGAGVGAMIGAQMGSVVPGLGTAIGAGVGALAGWLGSRLM